MGTPCDQKLGMNKAHSRHNEDPGILSLSRGSACIVETYDRLIRMMNIDEFRNSRGHDTDSL